MWRWDLEPPWTAGYSHTVGRRAAHLRWWEPSGTWLPCCPSFPPNRVRSADWSSSGLQQLKSNRSASWMSWREAAEHFLSGTINYFCSSLSQKLRVASPQRMLHLCVCWGRSATGLCQHQQHTVNHLPAFVFVFFPFVGFKLPSAASQAQTERRTRLPPASPGASAFSLPTPPALPKSRGHSEGRCPRLRSNMQGVSNSLPPEHHMVIIVWAMWCSDAFV